MEIQNLVPFDSLLGSTEPEFPGNLEDNFPALFQCVDHNAVPALNEGKKREATDMGDPSSGNSTPDISESGSKTKNVNFLRLCSFYCLLICKIYIHDLFVVFRFVEEARE